MGRKSHSQDAYNFAPEHYQGFEILDGSHPWQNVNEDGYISYPARRLSGGKVLYFNYPLAKEMGLIPKSHPHLMNPHLEKALLNSFCIQIINEFDELSKKRIPKSSILPKRYMATRYLQLQHSNKQGKTSGDGRGIWNGVVKNRGQVWDVSSRGTGVTRLAPGSVEAEKPLETGSRDIGYGCGLAEIDELLASAIMSESIHLSGIKTERTLCVIDTGGGFGIGVRAGQNLLRPAHVFRYLKQGRLKELKASIDYLIERQLDNKQWNLSKKSSRKYWKVAETLSREFAQFAATLEADYIFAWMDWDGDNLLADGGILDYGSVRQFGARHDQYRYDDVERYSTNLNEQKAMARLTVQNYVQIADFIENKKRAPLPSFSDHPILKSFDKDFDTALKERFLYRLGLAPKTRRGLLRNQSGLVGSLLHSFQALEKAKVGAQENVPDGINRPPLFNMRHFLREAPLLMKSGKAVTDEEIEKLLIGMLCKHASVKDISSINQRRLQLKALYQSYSDLMSECFDDKSLKRNLVEVHKKSEILNGSSRITGNALIQIVDELLWAKRRGLPIREMQSLIDRLHYRFVDIPEGPNKTHRKRHFPLTSQSRLYGRLTKLIDDYADDI